MDFNNLYKHVGYAQSLQLPATVHRNEKVIEKCHSNSALRKEKGHLKKWIKSGQELQREWYRKRKHFFAKQMSSTAPDQVQVWNSCLMIFVHCSKLYP